MSLPNPGMDAVPFTPITSEWGDDIIENIEALAAGTGLNAGAVPGSALNFAATGSGGIWWEEIGRTTLGVAGDTITLSSLPARKYLRVLYSCLPTGGTIGINIRYNNDNGNNYALRISVDGGADITANTTSAPDYHGAVGAALQTGELNIINISGSEKLTYAHGETTVAGVANAPTRRFAVTKWSNTSTQINRIDLINAGTGDYAIGSEIIVLGHN